MTRHTPGPWEVKPGKDAGLAMVMEKREGYSAELARVTQLDRDVEEFKVNARLIAAAPDLLAACLMARDFVLESDRSRNTPGWEPARTAIDAAIAKARGPKAESR